MSSVSSIALSGMRAAQLRLGVSAHNIANLGTDNFRRQFVTTSTADSGGVATEVALAETQGSSIEQDVVEQLNAKNEFFANLAVFRTSDAMAGALLSIRA